MVLLQVSPSYTRLATVDELAAQGLLRQEAASIFRTTDGHLRRQCDSGAGRLV
jgi:hypothetical protein